jgi:hypothetical protein
MQPRSTTPFARGNAARNGVEGDQPFSPLLITVQRESDPGAMKQKIGLTPTLSEQLRRRFTQPAGKFPIMRADCAARIVHLVIKGADHAVLLVTMDIRAFARPVPSA